MGGSGKDDDPWGHLPFEQRLIVWQRQLEQWRIENEREGRLFTATITFAGAAIKGLLLLNGGAAIAILAFLGHLSSIAVQAPAEGHVLVRALVPALVLFGWGAFFGAATAGASYIAQVLFSELPSDKAKLYWGNRARAVAILFALAGYIAFIWGLYKATGAFAPT